MNRCAAGMTGVNEGVVSVGVHWVSMDWEGSRDDGGRLQDLYSQLPPLCLASLKAQRWGYASCFDSISR
jgi:hypothetical protein